MKNKVHEIRNSLGLTITEMSRDIGITRITLSKIEKDFNYNLSLRIALKISRYFKMRIEDIWL